MKRSGILNIFSIFIIAILLFIGCVKNDKSTKSFLASDYTWFDYREPYTGGITVCHNKTPTITVDIPNNFLEKRDRVSFFVEIQSNSYRQGAGARSERSFEGYSAYLRVNGFAFGSYRLNTGDTPGNQSKYIEIKKKYLKSGENIFMYSYKHKDRWYCTGKCCSYPVSKLYFKDA